MSSQERGVEQIGKEGKDWRERLSPIRQLEELADRPIEKGVPHILSWFLDHHLFHIWTLQTEKHIEKEDLRGQ